MIVRPRRSILYVPGSNAHALEKAGSLAADGFILDLEDAVAPGVKERARVQVEAAVRAGGFGRREVLVRVNGLATPWGADDLAAVAQWPVDGVVLPKVESAAMLHRAEAALAAAGAPATLALWAMMETPRGILAAPAIAAATPRLAGLFMGTSDLTKDLHARHTGPRLPMLTALGLCLLAARAEGLAILDGVHLDLDDEDGFAAACLQGRDMGFDGKALIHPKTIALANAVFGPGADELAHARRVIAAYGDAEAAGRGVAVVDGQMIETLHVTEARRIVALADAIAALDG